MLNWNRLQSGAYYVPAFWLIVALAAVLRIHHLGFESLFVDEIRQVSYYPFGLLDIVKLAASQQQPPLDYWIGHFVSKINDSDFFVRLPAAVFGTASVAIVMSIGRSVTNRIWGLWAGVVLAILPFHIYYSQEARPYSIAIFLFLLLLRILLWIYETETVSLKQYLSLLLVSLLFLLSRTLSPLVCLFSIGLILFAVWLMSIRQQGLFQSETQRSRLIQMAVLLTSVLIYIPVLRVILNRGGQYLVSAQAQSLFGRIYQIAVESMHSIHRIWVSQSEPIGFLLLIGFLISLSILVKRRTHHPFTTVLVLVLPLAAFLMSVIFFSQTSSILRPPYMIFMLPGAVLASAIGFNILSEWIAPGRRKLITLSIFVISVIWIVPSLIDFKETRKKSDWRGVVAFLEQEYPEHTVVIEHLASYNHWKAQYFGFHRYVRRSLSVIDMRNIKTANFLHQEQSPPVLVFHRFTGMSLTSSSQYPVHLTLDPEPGWDSIPLPEAIRSQKFKGFWVFSLITPSGDFRIDLKRLLEATVLRLPASPSLIDSWLAYISVSLASGCTVSEEIFTRVIDNVPVVDKDKAAAFLEWLREQHREEMRNIRCHET